LKRGGGGCVDWGDFVLMETEPVIAGLDPAIHHLKRLFFSMDARVKPADDGF